MSRLWPHGAISRVAVAAALVIALGIAASIALAERDRSGASAPAASVRFPDAGRWYGGKRWFAGCHRGVGLATTPCIPRHCQRYLCRSGQGIRGVANDRSGVAAVLVSVRRDADRRYRRSGTFSSPPAHYVRATLTRHGTQVQWFRWLGLPRRDGFYTARALVMSGGAGVDHPAAVTTITFAVDHSPPPSPRVAVTSTKAHTARVGFSDSRPDGTFRCRLDAGTWLRCHSPLSYTELSAGPHRFAVRAVDLYGRAGTPTRLSAAIMSGARARLTISGRPTGLLYPGGTSESIPLRLTNPGAAPIVISGLSVSVRPSSLPGGCDPTGFQITQSNNSAAQPVRLGPYGSVILPFGGVTAPVVRMIDTHTNQDACQGGALALTYTGRAHR